MTKKLLTFSDVAGIVPVTRKTLYAWERSGRFNVKPFDDRAPRRWHIDDIAAWLRVERGEVSAINEA